MLLFGVSVSAMLVYIYNSTVRELETQIKQSVNIQLADLGRKFILDGTGETIAAINHLIKSDTQGGYVYMLINAAGEDWTVVAGNVDRWPGGSPKKRDWIRFNLKPPTVENPRPPQAIAINSSLPRGYILLVGHKLRSVERFEKYMVRTVWASMGAALFLGLAGGGILAFVINKRLEKVNNACDRVMQGELKHRIEVDGAGDEFDYLGRNFNSMLTRIEELIAGIKDISASVAHDLRTPLNRVRNRLEQMEQGTEDASLQEQIRAAISDVDRLVATFNSILRISQAEAGAGIERFAAFDFSGAVQDVTDLYIALAEEKGIAMTSAIEPGIELNGDRHLLSQAIANLIDNAIKYSKEGGEVDVALSSDDKSIVLKVTDTGPGIPEEFRAKVTEKFFRMENSRSAPGNGLGLSLAGAAFSLHGATLEFGDNAPGLIVTVTFVRAA